MKKPFSFPVKFIEELNALNFPYKSIHLMAHHSQWFLDWAVGKPPMLSKEWHEKYISSENVLKLNSEKPNCTRFHYLFRFVDIDDNISYGFEPIHHFCEEWNFAAEKTNNNPTNTCDPFGFGYSSNAFKKFVFNNITICDAEMLNKPKKSNLFQIIATIDASNKNEQCFGINQSTLIDTDKAVAIYKDAEKVAFHPKDFICAFFGFEKHTYIAAHPNGNLYFDQTPAFITYAGDLAALFYRDC